MINNLKSGDTVEGLRITFPDGSVQDFKGKWEVVIQYEDLPVPSTLRRIAEFLGWPKRPSFANVTLRNEIGELFGRIEITQ